MTPTCRRNKLWLEVVGARNLESRQAVDAYCVVQQLVVPAPVTVKLHAQEKGQDAAALPSRSPTIQSSGNPAWSHAIELDIVEDGGDAADPVSSTLASDPRVMIQVFNEKNFFFDMFPASSGSSSSSSPKSAVDASAADEDSRQEMMDREEEGEEEGSNRGKLDSLCLSHETDSDDDEDRELGLIDYAFVDTTPKAKIKRLNSSITPVERISDKKTTRNSTPAAPAPIATQSEGLDPSDEALGFLELSVALLRKSSRIATDKWYVLRGTRSGEIRIRTLWLDDATLATDEQARERIFAEQVYEVPMYDHYGFRISDRLQKDWAHLRSYEDCREERRVSDWERAFGTQFFSLQHHRDFLASENTVLRQLARGGIPRHWRERVYMNLSGAREKQQNAGSQDYKSLVEQSEGVDSAPFRQIELDIDRTFGHSGTKICTEEGRAVLRRILRAYSIRNPSIGYCQGLNFIVGFLTLAVEEEAAFWLLAVICEDLYPGYYTPTMAETQTDMLVLKELIADELPALDAFTADVGLPLELLGSQWLLCLFTTTFPSETVFRIFDCIFAEGSRFVFAVIIAHLRRLESTLIRLEDFQAVLSAMKDAENALLDADRFMVDAVQEADRIEESRITALREKHRESVRDEMNRAARARALNKQLAVVYQIPAFSNYAASLLRFFHEEAEVSSRSDVAFILTLLCHGLVWLAEHSQRWQRQ
uniref:Rab-GAP TBC domain-containing protein n=1 Tax=Globisporangium ultimum (strain ATCC 200006 / CBS 805.95 / DAOM BR144) TaxID=431595 RepID=K3WPV8_GLOUD